MKRRTRVLAGAAMALTLAGLILAPATALAQEKGASKLLQMSRIQTQTDVEALKPGDMVVMSCPKCRDTEIAVVEKSWKTGVPDSNKTVTVHLCPGCETKLVPQANKQPPKAVHTCQKCGSEDVSCCSIKKGETTAGMK